MQNSGNGVSFFQGMIFGAVIGATAGILLAPKSGAETRADIAAAAKKMQEKTEVLYGQAKEAVDRKVAALKEAGKNIDTAKYKQLVDDVVGEMKNSKEITDSQGEALGAQLKADSGQVVAALKA